MYPFIAWGLTLVIPLCSVLIEVALRPGPDIVWLVAKWFVFWGIGIRLLTAGIRQVMQPAFTAQHIFRVSDPEAPKLVVEIGFGNLGIGTAATLSLLLPALTPGAGLAGGIFLLVAGLQHIRNQNRTSNETTAMTTDLIVGVIATVSSLLIALRLF